MSPTAHLEGRADAEPDGQVEARLRPGEDPGDGAQRVDAAGRLALGGPAADVHARQLAHRRGRLEVVDEARVPAHHRPVRVAGHLGAIVVFVAVPDQAVPAFASYLKFLSDHKNALSYSFTTYLLIAGADAQNTHSC